MNIHLFIDYGRWSVNGEPDWRRAESWPAADCRPLKGELVKVALTAEPGQFSNVEPGAQVEREMRVLEVCTTGPRDVHIYLVPTNVKVVPT